MDGGYKAQVKYYPTGEEVCIGDVIELGWFSGRPRGRVVKHFLPEQNDPEASAWGMEDGGIMVELEDGQWFALDSADNELFFISRGS